MGGYALGSAFDSKSGQMIMVSLLLMFGSFFLGNLFGNNAPIYVSQVSETSSSSSSSSSAGSFRSLLFAHRSLENGSYPLPIKCLIQSNYIYYLFLCHLMSFSFIPSFNRKEIILLMM